MNINLTMIGQLIMFAMFTWFCMKFVWPPIIAAMEARKKRIESGLIAAERGLSEHKEAQQKAQETINQSKDQAAAIIANAAKQASGMVEDAKSTASQEADRIKTQAHAEIEQESQRVRNQLKDQVSELVMQGVNAVLDKEVDPKVHQDMLGKLSQTL
ncbi:F0F1 ATP synthase subunit B [Bathymodiolus septemdierum thioautotrophic gill symbiont]|uniref:ATP synthase subunit b n=1 Tax=endosymbiont of Bathymodiolus septemdierum str. Myojin knoll TaxID=1303921 RepID=A0A0P0UTN0_9GAMM|nr:F0F1 ATP synthase subunit B [Bathymodiolus septemdierum thioautotrophic gill symbiont]BAS68459.1 F-type H+-transporting ATPase subunit b [endosymbiont of Bathymodiolus septemdierum str. Myojin knoll]